jgi:imidazolonepropionase
MKVNLLVHRIRRLYTLDPSSEGLGQALDQSVAFSDGQLAWIGPAEEAPEADRVVDGRGLIGLPGLVDPHTHSIWAGSRSDEFARRLAGESYSAILEQGGGILSTVRATRRASREQLARDGRVRVRGLRSHGVTTVEIKSGYGLDPESEERMLLAANDLEDTVRVVPTFLGAHAIPPEYRDDREAYVRQVIDVQLPRCAPLAACVDVYCDRGAFSVDEARRILEAGRALGLTVRAHAEQVAHTGIAALAARMGATSVDHLEQIDDEGIEALAAHGTVAVLLPGAQLYLKDPSPPVEALREAGVPMAIGTDLNPGSSPVHDPWTCATLACLLQGLTIDEAILGITRAAGRALGRPDLGWLGEGSVADLALFAPPPGEPATVASLVQHMAAHRAVHLVRDGRLLIEDGRTGHP